MKLRYAMALAGVAIAGTVLAACGEPEVVEVLREVPVVVEVEKVAPVERVVVEGVVAKPVSAPSGETSAAAEAPVTKMARGAETVAAGAGEASADEVAIDRKIIRTGTLAIVVPRVDEAVQQVKSLVGAIPGAFIAASNLQDDDDPTRISTMTLRVPSEQFETAMASLRIIGVEVVDEDFNTQDVTEAYTDLEARLRNAEATERQLLQILDRAETVKDTIEVQRELGAVREDIEVLQGRLNLLANQVDLATIRLLLHPAPDVILKREQPDGATMHQQTVLELAIRNEGTVEVKDVEVVDRLDPGMVFVSASDDGRYDPEAHTVAWTIDRLGAGEQWWLVSTVRLEGDGSDMSAVARITAGSLDRETANNTAQTVIRFHVDLSVEKEGSAAVPVGRDAQYSLAFGNRGTADATDVRMVESLPEGMTFVRAAGGGRYDADQHAIVWEFARLRPGEFDTVSYVARVDREEGRLQTDTTISATQADRASVDNTATTFLTALPEEVATREVWSPGGTARGSVGALESVGRWLADTLIKVGIVGGPFLAAVAILWWPVRALWRRRCRRGDENITATR